jgi:hypothetical protein
MASSLNKDDHYIMNTEGIILQKLSTFCKEASDLRQKSYPKGDQTYI